MARPPLRRPNSSSHPLRGGCLTDCFKLRHKIGLDVVIESLRTCIHKRVATVRDIQHNAEICRVARVMLPYLEAIS